MKRPRKPAAEIRHLSRSLKKLGKSVGRMNRRSNARQVVNDRRIKERVVTLLGEKIRSEMEMCSLRDISILRSTSPGVLQTFKWESVLTEMQELAPNLLGFLRSCVQRTRKVPSKGQTPGQRTYRASDDTVVGVCAAILLRHRSQSMNLVQRMVSLLLYSGHAPKQVCLELPLRWLQFVMNVRFVGIFTAPKASDVSLSQENHFVCGCPG